MTTYAFPNITPNSSTWEYVSNTEMFESSLSRAIQTLDRGGEHWRCTLSFRNLKSDEKADLKAFLVKLNGMQHRFTLPDHSLIQRGLLTGTPLVAGAGQTGTSLNVDGCTGTTDWIKAGDMFEVDGKLKMAVEDADAAAGAVTIVFRPRIMTAPPDSDPITVADPTSVFLLADNSIGWSNLPNDFSNFTVVCREDTSA